MRAVIPSTQFSRDVKRMAKRGKDISKLEAVVNKLQAGEDLEHKHRPHLLVGDWKPKWECHVESDWLLIYEVTEDAVKLARTGTHADLF